MNDKDIRKILINFLLAERKDIRIYQEKSIGSSIFDVMAVSSHLTGYEIKSDNDDYSRLDRQASDYDNFFDKNYLVISQKHRKSAENKVPRHWGIISIEQDNVEVLRRAADNPDVSRRSQLSVLWKLELKNILVKNSMPMYAQKDKKYISYQISKQVDPAILGKQIAYELYNRDYSYYDAKDFTIRNERSTSQIPLFELLEKVAEDDTNSFTLEEWISLYSKAKELQQQKQELFAKPITPRAEHEINYTEIEVSLGAPWISEGIINDFIYHLLGIGSDLVKYEYTTGTWTVQYKKDFRYNKNTACTVKYGLKRYNALYIIEATMNFREIKLYDSNNKYDETDTIAALDKQRLIIEEFRKWIWLDEDRIWEVEEAYNKMFSDLEKKSYIGSKMVFPEMAENFELYDYQKEAVERIIHEKNTLLAFDVGSGKTYIMIAAAMKMRQMGMSHKNMFVVPNSIVGQWEKIFTDLYPNAKLLTIDPKSFKPELRQKVLVQMRDGNYDGIIIAYSCFEMIPLSSTCVIDNMEHQLEKLNEAVRSLRYGDARITIINREKEYIHKLTDELLSSMEKTPLHITFDQLEINTIFLDEAHNFKNIPIRTRLKNLRGINVKGSSKCHEMLKKIHCVQEQNGGRGAVLATGTPLCNSISDVYAMQMYLQYDLLESRHLHIFDNWVRTFAQPEQICEIDVDTSKFRIVRRFSRFFNLPELSLLFSQVSVFHATDKSGLPEFRGYDDIIIKRHKLMTGYMNKLCTRTDRIRSKHVSPREDNMLKVSTDGRKAALDLSLVGESQKYDKTSKIIRCINEIMKIYNENASCSQLVFCDYSTPKGEQFSVYAKLKEFLLAEGVPEKEIAFIHSYHTEQRKLELFRKVNSGEIRILIGSTFKLGIGANVQTKLKAIHHLDVPWRPADMIQREGRILRCGNENENVRVFRYIVEGSFDSYSWQVLETKQRFISQFLSGTSYQRSISDLESDVLIYGEVKAIALSAPEMKLIAEKENELRELSILKQKREAEVEDMRRELSAIPAELEKITAKKTDSAGRKLREASVRKLNEKRVELLTRQDSLKKELNNVSDYTQKITACQNELKMLRSSIKDSFINK